MSPYRLSSVDCNRIDCYVKQEQEAQTFFWELPLVEKTDSIYRSSTSRRGLGTTSLDTYQLVSVTVPVIRFLQAKIICISQLPPFNRSQPQLQPNCACLNKQFKKKKTQSSQETEGTEVHSHNDLLSVIATYCVSTDLDSVLISPCFQKNWDAE